MTSRDFCYWLQGYFEILGAANPTQAQQAITAEQTAMIARHLRLVFVHEIDPSINQGDKAKAALLDAVHAGLKPQGVSPVAPWPTSPTVVLPPQPRPWPQIPTPSDVTSPGSFTEPDKHPAKPVPETLYRC